MPESTSAKLPDISVLYAASSAVLASDIALDTVGASLVLVIVIVKAWVVEAVPSDTVSVYD